MFSKMMNKFFLIVVLVIVLFPSVSFSSSRINIIDIAGRSISIPKNVKRIILGEGRMIYGIAPLYGKYGNPFEKIVAWKSDLIKYDPDTYEKYKNKFPMIKKIVNLGNPYAQDLSLEKVISLRPDVMIMNLGKLLQAKESGIMKKLAKAGIATVFIDFRKRTTQNTVPSILILAKIVNRMNQALKFIDFYLKHMQLVYKRISLKKDKDRPLVFIENAAGWSGANSYNTFGSTNLGRLVEIAGGKNLGSKLLEGLSLSGSNVKVNPEKIFESNPDIIIGTGANWIKAKPTVQAVLLGYDADQRDVKKRLVNLANRKGWETLKSVKNKQFHSIYHQFYNSPYHFIALLVFAKWFYPEDFRDINPKLIFKDFHNRFLAINYSGMFWASL